MGGAAGGGNVVARQCVLAAVELLRRAVKLLKEGLEICRRAEEVLQRLLLDGIHQGYKEVVRFVLVLDEWVLLALGAQADAFAEGVHVVEVCLPLLVDGGEHHAALLLVEHFHRQITDADAVGLLDLGDEHRGNRCFILAAEEVVGRHAHRKRGVDPVHELVVVRLTLIAVGEVLVDLGGNGFVDDLIDQIARDFRGQHFVAIAVDDLALHVHHVVEIEHPLAAGVVALFDALLRGLDRAVEPRVLQRFAFLHAEALHHRGHAIRCGEVAHQVVFEGDEKLRTPWVTLARATAAQLAVDPARLVALGADHKQAAHFGHAGCEFDVGAASRHVGGNRDGADVAGAGDDFRLLLMELGVEHRVWDLRTLEQAGQRFRRLDRRGADQHRLAFGVGLFDAGDDRVELLAARFEYLIVVVDPDVCRVRRDRQHVEAIDVVELGGFRLGGAGHACQLFVQAEVVLNGDRRKGLRLLFDGDVFLRLDRLVESVGPAATRHFAAGVFVDDDHLVVLNHVLDVLFKDAIRFEQLGNVVNLLRLQVHAHLLCFLGGDFLFVGQAEVGVDVGVERAEVWQRERIGIARRKELAAHLHQVGVVALFVDDEVELFLEFEEFLLLRILVEGKFGLL